MAKQWDEEDEDEFVGENDDSSLDTDPCPHCGADIYVDGEWCPKCGKYLTQSERTWTNKQGWVVITGIALLLAMLVASVFVR